MGRWVRSGYVCRSPSAVALTGVVVRPVITPALVRRAFRELVFARPGVRIQPEGGITLVNLETFFRVRWAGAGFGPAEVAEVELLGRQVRLRPEVASVRYQFGDGTGLGPTSDLGGIYPRGRVRHTYQRAGSVPVSVVARYTGRYAIDAGQWRDVGIEVPVAGPVTDVQVKTAHARLIDNSPASPH